MSDDDNIRQCFALKTAITAPVLKVPEFLAVIINAVETIDERFQFIKKVSDAEVGNVIDVNGDVLHRCRLAASALSCDLQ